MYIAFHQGLSNCLYDVEGLYPLLKYPHRNQTLKPVVNIVFIDRVSEMYVQSIAIPLFLFDYLIS